jgi:hypothetical protein
VNSDRLHARARAVRSRALVRAFEYRQRDLAGGVWVRLRLALSRIERAYVIDDEDASALAADGIVPLSAGLEIEPPLRIFVVSGARARALRSGAPIPLHMDTRLLRAGAIAVVEFEATPRVDVVTGG